MSFQNPVIAYTSESNIEAHIVVEMLIAHGIDARADEDLTGTGYTLFGQFYKPRVWIDRSNSQAAASLIQEFEHLKRERNKPVEDAAELAVECEECGKTTEFARALNGTLQECSHCHAYLDVGELGWDDDFGEPDD